MKKEILARLLVLVLVLTAISIPIAGRWFTTTQQRNMINIHARVFENGSWGMNTIQTNVGNPILIRLTSEDVVHGFAVGGYEMTSLEVMPGEYTETTLMFDTPGEYTFFCTRWCGPFHTRMRGTIQVLP